MKKKTTTKTIHQKYAASMRLTKQERDRAYEFADSCGPALSASALYVKALKITLDLLQDPKKLKEVAPLSEELQELDTTRRNFANEYARQQEEAQAEPTSTNPERDELMKKIILKTAGANGDPAVQKMIEEYYMLETKTADAEAEVKKTKQAKKKTTRKEELVPA